MKNLLILSLLSLFIISCGDDDSKEDGGDKTTITFNVNYEGETVIKQLKVAIVTQDQYPISTMPNAMFSSPETPVEDGITFPVEIVSPEIDDGEYWALIYGDTDSSDGMMPVDADPQFYFGPLVVVNGEPVVETVTIEDDFVYENGNNNNNESISLTINYSGETPIKRVGYALTTMFPPVGMPPYMGFADSTPVDQLTFPYSFSISDIDAGQYWISLYGDIDGEGYEPETTDPQAVIGPINIIDGETLDETVELTFQ